MYEQPLRFGSGGRGGRRLIFDAGTAATGIVDLRPDVRTVLQQLADTRAFESSVAYIAKSRPRVLIIGAGGGEEVLDAAGVRRFGNYGGRDQPDHHRHSHASHA